MRILYSAKFARQYKKLPATVKDKAQIRETVFRKNPFDPMLKTHKLSGSLKGFYSFSIDQSYRIIFDLDGAETARFYEVGDHSIYE